MSSSIPYTAATKKSDRSACRYMYVGIVQGQVHWYSGTRERTAKFVCARPRVQWQSTTNLMPCNKIQRFILYLVRTTNTLRNVFIPIRFVHVSAVYGLNPKWLIKHLRDSIFIFVVSNTLCAARYAWTCARAPVSSRSLNFWNDSRIIRYVRVHLIDGYRRIELVIGVYFIHSLRNIIIHRIIFCV